MDIGQKKNVITDERSVSLVTRKSHDEFWGGVVIVLLSVAVLLAIGFFAFLGYRIYGNRSDGALSIADIPKKSEIPVSDADSGLEQEEVSEGPVLAENHETDPKQLTISVLNAGGGNGVAGALSTFLKQAGYEKSTAGNAAGRNYVGVTIFYQEGQEAAANAVLAEVVKRYPKAIASKADPKQQETNLAPITVVIGT